MVVLKGVSKSFRGPEGSIRALDGINLQVEAGEFTAVSGPSGSGKTTLLMIIAALMRPTSGDVLVGEQSLAEMSRAERRAFRSTTIGFVFQMFHLIPYLTVLENTTLAAGTRSEKGLARRAGSLLEDLGLGDRVFHRPTELSAGERQRTAIARALLNGPQLLLADEPTGNLDAESSEGVLACLVEINQRGCTVLVATHDPIVEARANQVVSLRNGRLL